MMVWKVLLFVELSSPLFPQAPVAPLDLSSRVGVVDLRPVDGFGMPIARIDELRVERLKDGKWTGHAVSSHRSIRAPYGKYRVIAYRKGHYECRRELQISSDYAVAFLYMPITPIEIPSEGNTVRAILSTAKVSSDCRWVRMMSAVSNTVFFEAMASTDGKVVFENVPAGTYVLVGFGADGICLSRQIEVKGEKFEDILVVPK